MELYCLVIHIIGGIPPRISCLNILSFVAYVRSPHVPYLQLLYVLPSFFPNTSPNKLLSKTQQHIWSTIFNQSFHFPPYVLLTSSISNWLKFNIPAYLIYFTADWLQLNDTNSSCTEHPAAFGVPSTLWPPSRDCFNCWPKTYIDATHATRFSYIPRLLAGMLYLLSDALYTFLHPPAVPSYFSLPLTPEFWHTVKLHYTCSHNP